jgi:serine/threonine protein kinase
MGAVYKGFDSTLGVLVAIKENRVEDKIMRAAFQREAQLLANLRHPSLPHCLDFLEVDGVQYLVMECIEGDDLATLMTKKRTWLSNETVEDLAWQMLDLLEYVHGESVLHRDIKPANIKLMDGRVYLLDFGLAYGQSGEMDTFAVGEFNWMYGSKNYSPLEQSMCRRTSPASDLYSLAATLYYLLTNVKPVDAEVRFESVSHGGRDPLEDIRLYNSAADMAVSRAVMHALSINADERPQSAGEMREIMFPKETAGAQGGRVRRFLSARLLSECLVLGVLAYLVISVLLPRVISKPSVSSPPVIQARTPPPAPAAPASEPSLSPIEEAAQLADEAERQRLGGDDEGALNKIERALDLNENNAYAHYIHGDILLDTITDSSEFSELMSEVIEDADRIRSLVQSPRSMQECLALTWADYVKATRNWPHIDLALLDQAIANSKEVLTKYDPDSVMALTIRASATWTKFGPQLDEQMTRRVFEDYDRVIKLAPKYAQAHANLAKIHLALALRVAAPARGEQLELASQGFEEAIRLTPRAGLYQYLGDVYFEMQNFEKAATNYLEANRLNQNSDNWREYVFTQLCTAYNNLNQFDRAAESCQHALELNANDDKAKQQLERARSAVAAGDR